MGKIVKYIDNYNSIMARAVSWLTLFMVVVTFLIVVQRYALNSNYTWQIELVLFMHSVVFLLASGYCLKVDEHVRVDVFYENLSRKVKSVVNLLGSIFFLVPVAVSVGYFSLGFVLNSWEIKEMSRESDGIGGIYILKSCILLFALNLLLQAVSIICKSVILLQNRD